jgi:hypothetical protein
VRIVQQPLDSWRTHFAVRFDVLDDQGKVVAVHARDYRIGLPFESSDGTDVSSMEYLQSSLDHAGDKVRLFRNKAPSNPDCAGPLWRLERPRPKDLRRRADDRGLLQVQKQNHVE